jgi:hypothetical protein
VCIRWTGHGIYIYIYIYYFKKHPTNLGLGRVALFPVAVASYSMNHCSEASPAFVAGAFEGASLFWAISPLCMNFMPESPLDMVFFVGCGGAIVRRRIGGKMDGK